MWYNWRNPFLKDDKTFGVLRLPAIQNAALQGGPCLDSWGFHHFSSGGIEAGRIQGECRYILYMIIRIYIYIHDMSTHIYTYMWCVLVMVYVDCMYSIICIYIYIYLYLHGKVELLRLDECSRKVWEGETPNIHVALECFDIPSLTQRVGDVKS